MHDGEDVHATVLDPKCVQGHCPHLLEGACQQAADRVVPRVARDIELFEGSPVRLVRADTVYDRREALGFQLAGAELQALHSCGLGLETKRECGGRLVRHLVLREVNVGQLRTTVRLQRSPKLGPAIVTKLSANQVDGVDGAVRCHCVSQERHEVLLRHSLEEDRLNERVVPERHEERLQVQLFGAFQPNPWALAQLEMRCIALAELLQELLQLHVGRRLEERAPRLVVLKQVPSQ
mmetsp:Transcript_20415/g.78278  ORF Transcript_20415/g.78278 Transcript_20415/m.78278 type:complete len:236 (-) Transcript_20415:461-1168(-)